MKSPRLKEKYTKNIIPALQKEFGYKNKLSVPRLEKITINSGVGKAQKEEKYLDIVVDTITRISGQKPITTKAKKAIAAFKIRAGMSIGVVVTLRGNRMYYFLDKLINTTLPRVRDFRGINPASVDANGNITIGFTEHIVFPEIEHDAVERIHGLEVTITTSAASQREGKALLVALGIPFYK